VHVDQFAVAVFADADLLPAHAHNAVGRDSAGNPVAASTTRVQRGEVKRRAGVGSPAATTPDVRASSLNTPT
jgi:hypothetical protein